MARRIADKTTVDTTKADRERINELGLQLTAEGPGTFGQRETIRWLLDWREQVIAATIDAYTATEDQP